MRRLFSGLFLALFAVLPMSGTIALRNLLLLVLVFLIIYSVFNQKQGKYNFAKSGWQLIPLPVKYWILFLVLFPLWAVQSDVAWTNLRGQWFESMLAVVVGYSAVLVMGDEGPSLFKMTLCGALSLGFHIFLSIASGFGLLAPEFYADPNLLTVWDSVSKWQELAASRASRWSAILADGFRGIEPMHGNLGYTASQSTALLVACIVADRAQSNRVGILWSLLIMIFCFMSITVAQSRGAILYGVAIAFLGWPIFWLKCSLPSPRQLDRVNPKPSAFGWTIILVVLGLFALVGVASMQRDSRWSSMIDKVRLGIFSGEPVRLLCDGLSAENEARIRSQFAADNQQYGSLLVAGLRQQDGGRILLMRAGVELVLENPRGLDGSRDSYKKLITEKCGHPPVLAFAHSHQGWLDLALALGWAGMILYAVVLLNYGLIGWRMLGSASQGGWAFALLLVSAFWFFRGFADSVYREHYLQMQLLLLAYLHGRVVILKKSFEPFVVG
jgi:hypothetical protein